MVTDLAEMMVERLTLFRSCNKILPTRIIVYRDGVSEGQFSIVVADELVKIKKSFRKFDTAKGTYTPKLTIVICVRAVLDSPCGSSDVCLLGETTSYTILSNER